MATEVSRISLTTPLRLRDFRLLWAGRNLSRLGDQVYKAAIGWITYDITGSASATGLVLGVSVLPQVLLALVGGTLGDRVNRRLLLAASDAASAVVMAVLATMLVLDRVSLSALVVVGALLGACSAFAMPALGPLIAESVPSDQLRQANALDSATFSAIAVTGPAIGGVLVAFAPWFAIGVNAATFAVAAATLVVMRSGRSRGGVGAVRLADLTAGLRYTRSRPWIVWTIALSLAVNVCCIAPFFVLLPVRSSEEGLPALAVGATFAVQGLGGIFASFAIGRASAVRRAGSAMIAAACAAGLAVLLLAVASGWVGLLLAGLALGASAAFNMLENTMLQKYVDSDFQSRVYGLVMFGSFALLPAAYAAAGGLSSVLGSRTVLLLGSGAIFAVCMLAATLRSTASLRQMAI